MSLKWKAGHVEHKSKYKRTQIALGTTSSKRSHMSKWRTAVSYQVFDGFLLIAILIILLLRFRSRLKNKEEETSNLVKRDKMGLSKNEQHDCWAPTRSEGLAAPTVLHSIFYIALYTFWKYFDPSWRPFLWQNSGWQIGV
ncbi:unnamed protein product [Citrullus colocynthis]|uniref:Uncharacterized protein n=1 Tax=Citrullus colocynthis TaxID=252529 RepID=A0ABP0Z4M9_9ROSI